MADPIHQFEIKKIAVLGHIGGHEIAFTNSALFMLIAVAGISLLMLGATSKRAIVPGRLQSVAELTYEFVADMLRSSAGKEGMKFFPLVFCLFTFILFANMIGLIPGTFTVTDEISVQVVWRADFENRQVIVESRNLERFGFASCRVPAEAIGPELLDEFGRLVLGKENNFRSFLVR